MSNRGKLFFPAAIFLFSLVSAGLVFASGQSESQLSTAQQLIKEKKYNDAILVLAKVMKNDPREFDRAQALLEQVYRARQGYNDKVAELIKVFNEGKLEEAYAIIKQLETLDRAPNAQTLQSQAYARQIATFVYDTKQFEDVMNKALPELKAGHYDQAIGTYLSGFDIGTDMFKEANYGNIVGDRVNTLRAQIRKSTNDYLAELKILQSERSSIQDSLSEPVGLTSRLATLTSTLQKIVEVKKRILDDTTKLKIQQESIVFQHTGTQNVPLIGFNERIVMGRGGTRQPEGIIATIDSSWESNLASVHTLLTDRAKEQLAVAKKSYDAKQWNQALGSFASARSYALLASRVADAWGMLIPVQSSLQISDAGWQTINGRLASALYDQALAGSAEGYTSLVAQAKSANEIAVAANTGLPSNVQLKSQRKQVLEVAANLRDIRSKWSGVKDRYASLSSPAIDTQPAVTEIDGLLSSVSGVLSRADDTTVLIVSLEGADVLSPVRSGLEQASATVDKAAGLIKGISPKNETGVATAGLVEKYPGQAIQLLDGVQSDLQGYTKIVSSAAGDLSNESQTVLGAPAIRRILADKSTLSTNIAQLNTTVSASLKEAHQLLFQAERYRQEGENELQIARNDLANRRFASARQQVAAAASSLDKSLTYREDPAVRRLRDQELPRLSAQIANDENVVVVQAVRDDINQGRQYYSQGNYPRAQDYFLRAESRWNSTNTQPNPEITTWLKYVNAALTINSGRVVSPTDPLYSEITQVLNLAQNDYDRAKQLMSEGKSAEAKSLLDEADSKLAYVKVPFPYNKDARVLSLKIQQLTNPQSFAATFRQKFDQAVSELKTNPQDGYVSLKDLQAIDPGYQGLSQELYRAEILTGIRRPPPDPAKITESNDLYQKAFNIVRQNVRAQFPIALSYLNRAIELDPNNQQAASLKDRISIDQGANTTVVMSSTDQIQFKLAQEQFIAKSYYEALRIVNQLLQDPKNQNYPPLVELKRRIESKI